MNKSNSLLNLLDVARFVYNYFLRQRMNYYAENAKGLSYFDNTTALTQLKKQPEFEWLNNVIAQSLQQALRNLDTAYSNFFKKLARFPKFKRKQDHQSFNVPQRFFIHDNMLDIPKCKGIKIKLHRTIEGIMKSVTISCMPSGKYFASILCEVDIPEPVYSGNEIGIHYGVRTLITDSDGSSVKSPKYLIKSEKRLKMLQRRLSRKQKDSKSRNRARKRFARLHEKIANQRKDFLNKTSKQLVSDNQAIYIENLAVSDMVKNHLFAKLISDSGWNIFVNMLKYKGNWYGCRIIEIDRFSPSSKRCHVCGYINESLALNDLSWKCPKCNTKNDRELNAATNVFTFGKAGTAQTIVPSSDGTKNACGEGSSSRISSEVSPSLKQETPSEPCPSES